jgi:hypothetical protein
MMTDQRKKIFEIVMKCIVGNTGSDEYLACKITDELIDRGARIPPSYSPEGRTI